MVALVVAQLTTADAKPLKRWDAMKATLLNERAFFHVEARKAEAKSPKAKSTSVKKKHARRRSSNGDDDEMSRKSDKKPINNWKEVAGTVAKEEAEPKKRAQWFRAPAEEDE